MNKNSLPVLAAGLMLLGLGGCKSIPEPGANRGPAEPTRSQSAARPDPFKRITKGMTAAEVRALVGEPQEIKKHKVEDTEAEVWRYPAVKVDEVVTQVPVGTRDVPSFNPFTGLTTIIKEPIMGEEFTTLYHDIVLLMIGDRVIEIARRPRVERNTVN